MTVLGPLLAHGVFVAITNRAAQSRNLALPRLQAIAQMEQFPSQCSASVVLVMLGILCAVAGFLLVAATLVLHVLNRDAGAASRSRTPLRGTPAAQPSFSPITHGSPA